MPYSRTSGIDRRLFLSSVLGAAAGVAGLSGCAGGSAAAAGEDDLSAPLAAKVPAGTSLMIASYSGTQQLQLKLGRLGDPPFKVTSWANISAGPDVINAFRSGSRDV